MESVPPSSIGSWNGHGLYMFWLTMRWTWKLSSWPLEAVEAESSSKEAKEPLASSGGFQVDVGPTSGWSFLPGESDCVLIKQIKLCLLQVKSTFFFASITLFLDEFSIFFEGKSRRSNFRDTKIHSSSCKFFLGWWQFRCVHLTPKLPRFVAAELHQALVISQFSKHSPFLRLIYDFNSFPWPLMAIFHAFFMVFHGHRWFFNPGHLQRCNEKSRRGQDREGWGNREEAAPILKDPLGKLW